ncbi:MAG TPA: AMP-binding protein [Sporichthyaceae bacterium]|jgi:acyl-CoA synthetase (AMP-forming)/AMP-acid ligase II
MNTGDLLTNAARSHPDHPAFIFQGASRTYRESDARAAGLARALVAAGVARGDRVALYLHNCPEYLEAIFAILKLGGVVVPLNATFTADEVAWHLADSGATVLIADAEVDASVRVIGSVELSDLMGRHDSAPFAAVHVEADDLAWIAYSSGTTGRPKGAMLTHGGLIHQCLTTLADVERMEQHHVGMHAAPLSHGSGHNALAFTMKACTQVIHQRWGFDASLFLQQVEQYRVAALFLVPTQIKLIVEHPDLPRRDLSSLQWLCYGGAPMYREDQKRALRALGPVLVQIFGQAESPMSGTVLTRDEHSIEDGDGRERSVGRVRVGMELRILDGAQREVPPGEAGEICLRGPTLMAGYWQRPEATAATLVDGWLHTGDVGMLDEHGYLFILDRLKDMIISGGLNVYPHEIEDVLLTHPAVAEACVIGVPDEKWGEAVRAVVVPVPGAHIDAGELIAFSGRHLAGYKKPKAVDVVEALPRTSYGKIAKREVRAPYWAGLGRSI